MESQNQAKGATNQVKLWAVMVMVSFCLYEVSPLPSLKILEPSLWKHYCSLIVLLGLQCVYSLKCAYKVMSHQYL